jgi:hypothetical protein
MRELQIIITLEKNNETINTIEINGCTHDMFCESEEEKAVYQEMTVREFIKDYVNFYKEHEEE